MNPLELVKLTALMSRTMGNPGTLVGLIDGPVAVDHPDLEGRHIREISSGNGGFCTNAYSIACQHGTFVAGILCGKRQFSAPAICPACTLLVRPISAELPSANGMPSAQPEELAQAIMECVKAGAQVLNISAAIAQPSSKSERSLEEALDQAARRGVIVVAAAGNQGTLGSTAITSHPSVIPVVAYDLRGRPMDHSNLAHSIGRQGLGAPGDEITSVNAAGGTMTLGGTSAAVPFVTGTIALLRSEFPNAPATHIKLAIGQTHSGRRNTVVPPQLDAWAAYRSLLSLQRRNEAP